MQPHKIVMISMLTVSLFAAENIQSGIDQLEKQNYEASYNTFSELFKKERTNPQINFYLGRSAFEIGRYEEALAAFERVLILDPNHHRSRLELARTYIALGMLNDAKGELIEVQKNNPPKEVAQNIDALLKAIEAKRERGATVGSITLGASYDTNINTNPGQEQLRDYLSEVYNTDKSKVNVKEDEIDGGAISESLYVRNIYDIGDEGGLFFDSSLLLYNQNYGDHPKYDVIYLSVLPGIGYAEGNSRWLLQAGYDHLIYGQEELLNSFSLIPKYSYDFGEGTIGTLYLKHQRKLYDKESDKGKDAALKEGGIEAMKSFGKSMVSASIGYGKEDGTRKKSDDKFVQKEIYNLKLSYIRELLEKTTMMLQYNCKLTNYDDTYKPESNDKREDKYNSILVNLNYEIAKNYNASAGYNYIKNSSDYTPGEYDKSIFMLNFSYNF